MKPSQKCISSLIRAEAHLRSKGVMFDLGLSDQEIDTIQTSHGFVFPPDLRWFLQHYLPSGRSFPDWRGSPHNIAALLQAPTDGILFDVAENEFWMPKWGKRPTDPQIASNVAQGQLLTAPKLIPIFGHSYLPSLPPCEGNPVISIHQSDAIYRGGSLAAYLLWIYHDEDSEVESDYPVYDSRYTYIEFWSDLVHYNYES